MTLSLLTLDAMGSPKLARSNGEGLSTFRHAPFGADKLTGTATNIPGFNGQRRDPVSGSYHLGNGYRAYNPLLMRFNCPDNLSPFGAGGINPYAYCSGDPINRADPSGHISWQAGVGIGLGILGIIATAGAAAMAISAAGGISAALSVSSSASLAVGGLGVVADAVGIASGVVSETNPELSATLGWVSLATGIAGMGLGIASLATKAGRNTTSVEASSYAAVRENNNSSQPLGAAFLPMTQRTDADRNALSYVANKDNFIHEFFGEGLVLSRHGNKAGGDLFYNQYRKNTWVFKENFRSSAEKYFASNVAEFQYKNVSINNNYNRAMPTKIIREHVVNQITLTKTQGLTGQKLTGVFLNETPNGRSTRRIMELFNLQAEKVLFDSVSSNFTIILR